jgi:hypothetical protein
MPIEVGLDIDGEPGPRMAKLEVRNQRDRLTIPLDQAPKSLTLDPRTVVLMDAELSRRR